MRIAEAEQALREMIADKNEAMHMCVTAIKCSTDR